MQLCAQRGRAVLRTRIGSANQTFGAGSASVVTSESKAIRQDADKATVLRGMVGKKVLGKYSEFLGYIISVDDGDKMASLKSADRRGGPSLDGPAEP